MTGSTIGAISAQRQACKDMLYNFDAKSASIDVMQAYARCVELIYPSAMTQGEIISIVLPIAIFSSAAFFVFLIWLFK